MALSTPLKLGIAGAGRAAQLLHAPALARLREYIEVKAVADIDTARARGVAAGFNGSRVCGSVSELFDDPEIGAVAILTPPASHSELATAALRAGKHVFVEKPLAHSAAEAGLMADVASGMKRCAAVGHNLRFHRLVRRALHAIRSGRLGRLIAIETEWNSPHSLESNWRSDPEQGGGVVFDLGIHHVDLARFLTSSEFVDGAATIAPAGPDNTGSRTSGLLENGVRFGGVWTKGDRPHHVVRLTGDAAIAEFSMYGALSWRVRPSRFRHHAGAIASGFVSALRGGDSTESYRLEWIDFARAALSGSPPACTFDTAAKSVAVCATLANMAALV